MKKIGQGGNILTILPIFVLAIIVLIPTLIIDTTLGIMMSVLVLGVFFIQIKTRSVFIDGDKLVINTFFFKKKYLKIEDVKQVGQVFFSYYYIAMQNDSYYYFAKPFFVSMTNIFSLENPSIKKDYAEKIHDMLNKNGNLN